MYSMFVGVVLGGFFLYDISEVSFLVEIMLEGKKMIIFSILVRKSAALELSLPLLNRFWRLPFWG